MRPSERLDELILLMREKAPTDGTGPGVSEDEVNNCERQLGVTLPDSYKQFLREIGFATWPDEVYGLPPSGSLLGPNVLGNTAMERSEAEPEMPHHLIPFYADGWGNHFCLDTSQIRSGECPVVFWDHDLDADQQPEQTHATFVEWLDARIRRRLEREARRGSGQGS